MRVRFPLPADAFLAVCYDRMGFNLMIHGIAGPGLLFAGLLLVSGCGTAPVEYATTGYVPQPLPAQSLPNLQGSYHTVKNGETLWRIARYYGLEPATLAQANPISRNGVVTIGQRLFIPLPPESNRFVWPLRGRASQSHSGGIDISAASGTLVRASRTGRVAVATTRLSGWGNSVVMDHADGSTTVYAGLEQLVIAPGVELRQGMPIGTAGSRPLHFEIRQGSKPANTLALLPRE